MVVIEKKGIDRIQPKNVPITNFFEGIFFLDVR